MPANSGVDGTRASSHSPAWVASGTLTSATKATTGVATPRRRRAAGHTAEQTTMAAATGTRTTTTWTNSACAGSPDVVVVHTSPPVDGRVSLGTEVNILPAALDAACASGGLVVAQVNRRMPYTYGDAEISIDAVDVAIEVDVPLPSPAAATPDDTRTAIGERVAGLVPDGATVQLGIGAVPNATPPR